MVDMLEILMVYMLWHNWSMIQSDDLYTMIDIGYNTCTPFI